jgi:CBS domain-containing protein
MTDEPPSPKAEFFMAVAGPLSSIFLSILLFIIRFMGEGMEWPKPVLGVITYLALINLILAGFNLLPAFPLDGGRVLRSVLWGWKDNLRWATRIASSIGSFFGTALIIFGALSVFMGNLVGGIWWLLIGMFMRGASQMSYQQVILRHALEGEKVERFMSTDVIKVPSSLSVEELIENYIYKHHFKMFPVVDNEKLIGCVNLKQVKDIPRDERKNHKISKITEACSKENTIKPDEDALQALAVMRENNASRLLVVEGDKLVGVLALKDMLDFLSLKIDLES